MRVAAYMEGNFLKLCIIFLPGDPDLLENFYIALAYGVVVPNRDLVISQYNLTPLVSVMVTEAAFSSYQGIMMSSYVISLPSGVLTNYTPLSLGFACKMVQLQPITDIADIDLIDGVPVRLFRGSEYGLNPNEGFFSMLANDNPENWDQDQVCKTTLQSVGSHDGVTTYEVTDANCETLLKQFCSPTKCAGRVGDQVVSVDPGFLISHLE